MRAARGLRRDIAGAATTLSRAGVTSKSSLSTSRTSVQASPSAPAAPDRASTLALTLLALSGLSAGIALLPMRPVRSGHHRPALSFVERHRLELAGVSTSCLLVALLVFAGLI